MREYESDSAHGKTCREYCSEFGEIKKVTLLLTFYTGTCWDNSDVEYVYRPFDYFLASYQQNLELTEEMVRRQSTNNTTAGEQFLEAVNELKLLAELTKVVSVSTGGSPKLRAINVRVLDFWKEFRIKPKKHAWSTNRSSVRTFKM
jgi:hypothetical protein